jgi:hypothetical protein
VTLLDLLDHLNARLDRANATLARVLADLKALSAHHER